MRECSGCPTVPVKIKCYIHYLKHIDRLIEQYVEPATYWHVARRFFVRCPCEDCVVRPICNLSTYECKYFDSIIRKNMRVFYITNYFNLTKNNIQKFVEV
jgi:hypothetical protein